MAFVVEDGSGLTNSNSFASVAEADAYFSDRGVSAWAALTTDIKQVSLIKATDYLEATYSQAWIGDKASLIQALSFPRLNMVADGFFLPSNEVPAKVIAATIEMALRASSGEVLISDQSQQIVKEKVDVIETTYSEFSDPAQRYPFVNKLLSGLLRTISGGNFGTTQTVRT